MIKLPKQKKIPTCTNTSQAHKPIKKIWKNIKTKTTTYITWPIKNKTFNMFYAKLNSKKKQQ